MDLTKIYQELMALRQDHSMTLSIGCADHIFDGLLNVLYTAELLLTQCTVEKDHVKICILGKAKPACFQAEGTLSITVSAMDGKIQGAVSFSCIGEYTFSDFFKGNERIADSPYKNFMLRSPVFTARLEDAGKGMNISGSAAPDFSDEKWDLYRGWIERQPVSVSGYFFYNFYGEPCVNMDFSIRLTDGFIHPFSRMPFATITGQALSAVLAMRMVTRRTEREIKLASLLMLHLGSVADDGGNEGNPAFADGLCLQVPIMTDTAYVEMAAFFTPALSVGNVLTLIGRLTGTEPSGLLPKDTFLSAFGLKYIGIQADKDLTKIAQPKQMQLLFALERPWQTPIPHLSLHRFQVTWTASWWGNQNGKALMTAEILAYASVQIGSYTIGGQVRGYLPQMLFEGRLSLYKDEALSLRDLAADLDAALPEQWKGQNEIASMSLSADFSHRTLCLSVQAEDVLSVNIGSMALGLDTISASIAVSPAGMRFGVEGGISFGKGDAEFVMLLSAQYDNGWSFSGRLGRGEVNIGMLLEQMFGIEKGSISEKVFTVSLQEFEFSYSVRSGQFELYAVMASRWPAIKGMRPELGGRIRLLKQERDDTLKASAAVYASIGRFSCLAQADDFYGASPEYLFRVQLGNAYVQAVYTEKSEHERILTLSLGGMTLGGMVEALLHLINPNAKTRLERPWDVLNKISLSAFLLEINVATGTAVFWIHIGKSLAGLIELDRIGLKYENGHVSYLMTGTMLGQEYDAAHPVSWDAQNGKPPTPSAQETKVYYAGIGQHIAVDVGDSGIAQAVKHISGQLKPGQPKLAYQEENGFLFAADFAVADMFRLKAAFVDPQLYGVQAVVCASEKSPIAVLNGLELELLYRKISDSTGMFSCTLIVPKRFSVIQIGAVTVYIGRIHVELYTNGSFLIDLGFPHDEDFSQSFGVDFGIYTGKGGLYFGILKGDAVQQVPATEKGVFSPAVLIGLGVSLGLGRSFDLGIVKGSVSLVLTALFEGVFAVFHPAQAAGEAKKEDEMYYHVRAKAGVCGTLFLSVDFKIIAIRASARIEAACSLELESYQDTEVTLQLALEVSASIKILFIRISFSFSFRRTVTFKIASGGGTAPWAMEPLKNGKRRVLGPRPLSAKKLGMWEIRMHIMPVISICDPSKEVTRYCAAFLAFVDAADFKAFMDMMLAWILCGYASLYYERSYIDACGDYLLEQLDGSVLFEFFAENLNVYAALAVEEDGREEAEAVSFPMLPGLVLQKGAERIDFGGNLADSAYFDEISEYFARLNADPCADTYKKSNTKSAGEKIPLCEGIAIDYCKMLLSEIMDRLKELFEEVCPKEMRIADVMEIYRPDAERFLLANPDLVIQNAVLPDHIHVLEAQDTLEALESLGEEPVWQEAAQKSGILRFGTQLSGEFIFANQTGLSPKQAAALFYVRYSQADILYLRFADKLTECGIAMDWECEEPYSMTLAAGLDRPYTVLAGDTLVRIAKMLAVLADDYQDEAWEAFYQDFLAANGLGVGASEALGSYRVCFTTILKEDPTPAALFRRIYPDFTIEPQKRGLWKVKLFQPLQEIRIGAVDAGSGKTIGELLDRYGMEEILQSLSAGKLEAAGGQSMRVPNPGRMPAKDVREGMSGKSGEIGSMMSRFFLQGLRAPAPDTGKLTPLYELLKQQFAIVKTQDIELALSVSDPECQWLAADETPVTLTAEQIAKMLPSDRLPRLELPRVLPACEPHGSYTGLSDLRILDHACTVASLPDVFRTQICKEYAGQPERNVQAGRMEPILFVNGGQTDQFRWSAVLKAAVCRTGKDAYLVTGASAEDRKRLLAMSKTDIQKLGIAFEPSRLSSDKSQLVSASADNCILVKTNLSVETHMGKNALMGRTRSGNRIAEKRRRYSASITDASHFLELFWQCSVIGGGFWMHCEGIPEDIFDEDGTGSLYLYAVFQDFASARTVADSIVLSGNYKELVFYDPQNVVYAPASPVGTVSLESQAAEDGEISELFQIMSYVARMGEEQIESAPVFPQKRDGGNSYQFTIPLYRLADPKNCYSAVGKQFSIETGLRDILGNYVKFADIEITGAYNDEVLSICEYPRTRVSYEILSAGQASELHVCVEYIPSGSQEHGSQEEKQENDLARAKTAIQQLACEGMYAFVTCSAEGMDNRAIRRLTVGSGGQFEQLRQYARQLYESILSGREADVQNVEFVFTLDDAKVPEDIFPLSVSFGMVREGCASECERIRRAESVIPPKETMQAKAGFGSVLLASCGNGLYGVGLGTFFKKLQVEPYEYHGGKTPVFYAMKPFANELITRNVTVRFYDGTAAERAFCGCDLNAWMKRFFEDVEDLLSGEHVCMAAAGSPDAVEQLTDAKRKLAEHAAERVIPLCAEFPENTYVAGLCRDHYLASLSNVYALDVAAVYQAEFVTAKECRAEVTLKEEGRFLAQKITGNTEDAKKQSEFVLFSCHAAHRNTKGDLRFFVRDIEYHIDREAAGDYDSSDWIRLHEPLELEQYVLRADFGVPHPLLLCPPAPSIKQQEAIPGRLGAWNYKITMSCPAYEQYTICLGLQIHDRTALRGRSMEKDAFDILADYDSQREQLWEQLAKGNYDDVYSRVGTLADDLADAMRVDIRGSRKSYLEADISLALQLAITDSISLTVNDTEGALEQLGAKIGAVQILSGKTTGDLAEFSITIEDLPICLCQYVKPSAYIRQNENLFEGNAMQVKDEFLFCSEEVAADPLHVSLIYKEIFDVQGEDVPQAVQKIWQALGLLEKTIQADMEIHYSYALPGMSGGFEMDAPVTFIPQASQEAAVADQIMDWFSDKRFLVSDGRLYFDIWLRDAKNGRLAAQMRIRAGIIAGETVL